VGYVRVSTEQQALEGWGLAAQERAVRAWARARPGGGRLVSLRADEGVSGSLEDRPGLALAFADLVGGRAEGIVVARLDRLARDLIVQERLFLEVHRLGGVVRSANPTEDLVLDGDPTDPDRRFIRRVLGAAAELDRDMVALRLAAGREAKRAAGGYAGGRPPFGYRAHGGALVPVPEQQAAITRIRAWREKGWPLQRIADEISTPDRSWSRETVRAVLVRAGDQPLTPHETAKRRRREAVSA
jgi:DNA invertase Pin-like site-specific DNA recombinase